jgi:antitoxin YefM
MNAITYTHARSHLAETMEKVCDDHAPVIITRKNERSVVMISLEDYQALEETAYLLRSPKNARRLLESIAELAAGGGTERELLEYNWFSPSTPEPLKHGMSGYWSRRITDEHRMVYKVDADALFIAQLRYHYWLFCSEAQRGLGEIIGRSALALEYPYGA